MPNRTERAKIWQKNYFHGDNLRSSPTNLPELLKLTKAKTVFDLGCGQSHFWELPYQYTGADICGDLIDDNRARHPDVDFVRFDGLTEDIPRHDVIICKDVFEFLPNKEINTLLNNIYQSGSTWLIANSDPRRTDRPDTGENVYRPVNLQLYGAKLVLIANNNLALFELTKQRPDRLQKTPELALEE